MGMMVLARRYVALLLFALWLGSCGGRLVEVVPADVAQPAAFPSKDANSAAVDSVLSASEDADSAVVTAVATVATPSAVSYTHLTLPTSDLV